MSNIFWTAYSSGDRFFTINTTQDVVAAYGDIVDFKLYSDISIVFTIEIQERKIDALYNKLKEHLLLDDYSMLNSKSGKERVIYLNVSFAQASGNLRVEVPSVPG